MPREEIDWENIPRYKNTASQNLESEKQLEKKTSAVFAKSSNKQFQKYQNELQEKNTYFSKSKMPNINETDLIQQDLKQLDKYKKTNALDDKELDFCQKCPTNKTHCPHKNKKEQIKDKYSYPIVSSSVYGWLPQIDNLLGNNHNLNSVTRGFYDSSHL